MWSLLVDCKMILFKPSFIPIFTSGIKSISGSNPVVHLREWDNTEFNRALSSTLTVLLLVALAPDNLFSRSLVSL